MWVLADESYYDEEEEGDKEAQARKNHLPPLEWFKLNKYVLFFLLCILIFHRDVLIKACDFYARTFSELKKHSKKKTKERNNKKMLEEQNKWSDIPTLITATERELKQVLQLDKITGKTINVFYLIFFNRGKLY
jgi:hypothetical protein